jgi:hypothetical protein
MDFSTLFARPVHPDIIRFAQHCMKVAGERAIPRRRDFDPHDGVSYFGNLYVIEVFPDKEYRPSLFGAYLAVLYDRDMTEVPLSKFNHEDLRKGLRATYDAVVTSGKPLYQRGSYIWPDKTVQFERLIVPVADGEDNINALFCMTVLNLSSEELENFKGSMPDRIVSQETMHCCADAEGVR